MLSGTKRQNWTKTDGSLLILLQNLANFTPWLLPQERNVKEDQRRNNAINVAWKVVKGEETNQIGTVLQILTHARTQIESISIGRVMHMAMSNVAVSNPDQFFVYTLPRIMADMHVPLDQVRARALWASSKKTRWTRRVVVWWRYQDKMN